MGKNTLVKYIPRCEVLEGAVVPRGFGIAYYHWDRAVAVCLPVPLNWIVWALRRLWLYLQFGPKQQYEFVIYQRGFQAGQQHALTREKLDANL